MTMVKCDSEVCFFNDEGICTSKEIELSGNMLQPQCQTIEWDPNEVVIGAD